MNTSDISEYFLIQKKNETRLHLFSIRSMAINLPEQFPCLRLNKQEPALRQLFTVSYEFLLQ